MLARSGKQNRPHPMMALELFPKTYEIKLNAEAEAVQIILTGIDNDIYSTVDACPNACEMWKAIERLKQGESINMMNELGPKISVHGTNHQECPVPYFNYNQNGKGFVTLVKQKSRVYEDLSQQSTRNRGKAIVTSSAPTYDPEPATVTEDEEMSKEKEIDNTCFNFSLYKKIYKPTNNNLQLHQTTSRANQDNL
ncbi:hypothetical protein Tco_0382123 [Tanacetum coccineum]